MEATAIDHVNVRVPTRDLEDYVEFYRDDMGFDLDYYDEYQAGERDFFYVRLGEDCIVHVSPRETIPEPDGRTFNHFAAFVDESIDAVKARIEAAAVEILTEAVREGGRGEHPCVYVEDPVGYTVEFEAFE